ncbi:hypothetical protein JCM3765_003629 [Sporobolomyces pararoseus]
MGICTDDSFTLHLNFLSLVTVFAIKEECKGIISQLLSYGIPPDYMLSIGVSREILKLAFFELHLDLNLIPPSPNLSAQSTPFEPSSNLSALDNHQEAEVISLEALEQEKRKKLFAKKAALKLRNQRQAQNLESELETLFSSFPPQDVTMNIQPVEEEEEEDGDTGTLDSRKQSPLEEGGVEEPLAKRPRHSLLPPPPHSTSTSSSDAEHLHSLRESIDHTEETVEIPPTGPFAYNPSFAHHSQLPPPPPSSSSTSRNGRPRATDLEHLPAQRLSENALSRQKIVGGFGGSLFNGNNGNNVGDSLIIEISDEEDEGEFEETATTTETEQVQSSIPSRTHSPSNLVRIPSSIVPPNPSASSKAAQVGEILRQRQLLEKELEIKKIMEKIKDMESRKKRGGSSTPTPIPSIVGSESVSVLEEKKEDAVEESSIESNVVESQPVYRPYNSTLSRYPLLGGKPQPSFASSNSNSQSLKNHESSNSDSTTTTKGDEEDVGSAGLSTFIAKKHQLDPTRKWCKAESFGGVCQDFTGCKNIHQRDFEPKEEEKAEYLLQQQQRHQ